METEPEERVHGAVEGVGISHLPFKQGVAGSTPVGATNFAVSFSGRTLVFGAGYASSNLAAAAREAERQ